MVDTKWLMAIGVVGLGMATVVSSARAGSLALESESVTLGGKDGGAMELGGKDGGVEFKKDGGAFELASKKDGGLEFAKDGGALATESKKDGGAFELSSGQ